MDRTIHTTCSDTMAPTPRTYVDLARAYAHFNTALFDGSLPNCLITLQRRKKTRGYFSSARFQGRVNPDEVVDEIALNPEGFDRPDRIILSTLVHEMCHLWQYHYGTPSRNGYHNQEWGERMRLVGLMPSATGEPGGRATGQAVTHYIIEGGAFDIACSELLQAGQIIAYVDPSEQETSPARARKQASKTRYRCGGCELHVWGKPGIQVQCVTCGEVLVADDALEG